MLRLRTSDCPYGHSCTHGSRGGGGSTLTTTSLDPIVQEAIRRWDAELHLSQIQTALLNQVNFQIADLSGLTLAQTSGSTITLDSDAAGYGWYIDSTPSTTPSSGGTTARTTCSRAQGALPPAIWTF